MIHLKCSLYPQFAAVIFPAAPSAGLSTTSIHTSARDTSGQLTCLIMLWCCGADTAVVVDTSSDVAVTWIVSIIFIHVAAQSARQSAELEVELVLAPPCIEYWPGPIMTRVCRYCVDIVWVSIVLQQPIILYRLYTPPSSILPTMEQ